MTVAEVEGQGGASHLNGQRIVIVMMSAIGDAVHVLPVANALKRHAPDCHLTWVIQPLPASLVRGHDAIDELIEFDPYAGLSAWLGLRQRLRRRRFDLVLDLQVALKGGLVTAMIRAPRKLGFDRRRARDGNWLFTSERIEAHAPQHVQDQYFEFLGHLDVPAEPVEWRIGPWPDERPWQDEFFGRFSQPVAALNIATSDPDRDWLPERWAQVVDALHDRYALQAVIVGGPSSREKEMEASIRSLAAHRPVSALGSGLRRLVAILDGAALVLALDSAPLHIARALDRPVISLMSNADPRRTGPYRRFHDLIVDAYHDPGEQAPVSMTRRPGRMERIAVDDVLARVERWDERYRTTA